MYRVAEVAEAIGVSRSKVASMIQRGELPAARLGRSVRVPATELKKWILERTEDQPDSELPASDRATEEAGS